MKQESFSSKSQVELHTAMEKILFTEI